MRCKAGSSSTTSTDIWRSPPGRPWSLDVGSPMLASRLCRSLTATAASMSGRRKGCLVLALVCIGTAWPAASQTQTPQTGAVQEPITPVPPAPIQNPQRVALGDRLFHDTRLSQDNTRSCNSCHDTQTNGASANGHDLTPDGQPIALNTPTVFNAALNFRLNWEGNFRTLEAQAEFALKRPEGLGASVDDILKRLKADPRIEHQFDEVYGHGPDRASVLDAIAIYERSLVTPGSRFDRWLQGDARALSAEEQRGYQLFKSLGCVSCHQGVNIGGNLFQRHGIFHPLASPKPEVLRVPSLRNVATTPPYFHDGSAPTLRKAVRKMAFAQLDERLSDEEVEAIVAFLNTLTGTYRGVAVTAAPP